jgi:hypothetical protein
MITSHVFRVRGPGSHVIRGNDSGRDQRAPIDLHELDPRRHPGPRSAHCLDRHRLFRTKLGGARAQGEARHLHPRAVRREFAEDGEQPEATIVSQRSTTFAGSSRANGESAPSRIATSASLDPTCSGGSCERRCRPPRARLHEYAMTSP